MKQEKNIKRNPYTKQPIQEKKEQDRWKDQKNKLAYIATERIRMPTRNVRPESRCLIFGKFAKVCRFEQGRQQEISEITEAEITKKTDTDIFKNRKKEKIT